MSVTTDWDKKQEELDIKLNEARKILLELMDKDLCGYDQITKSRHKENSELFATINTYV